MSDARGPLHDPAPVDRKSEDRALALWERLIDTGMHVGEQAVDRLVPLLTRSDLRAMVRERALFEVRIRRLEQADGDQPPRLSVAG